MLLRSKKDEAEPFMDWVVETILPREVRKLAQHQHAMEEKDMQHQLAIEDKNSRIALLNVDLDESQREYAILEYKYEQLEARAVPYLENPKKNNGMVIIQKNNGDEYPYKAICGQQGYVAQKIQNKLIDFPNGQIVVLAETPNSICHYNFLRERGCIEVNPDRVRHFRLGRNLRHRDLLGIQEV